PTKKSYYPMRIPTKKQKQVFIRVSFIMIIAVHGKK
ncbi:MAG: hypothetical protein ACI849_000111, partial [Patiriisocius sp.]